MDRHKGDEFELLSNKEEIEIGIKYGF